MPIIGTFRESLLVRLEEAVIDPPRKACSFFTDNILREDFDGGAVALCTWYALYDVCAQDAVAYLRMVRADDWLRTPWTREAVRFRAGVR